VFTSVKPTAKVDYMPYWAKYQGKPFIVSMGLLEVAYADRESAEKVAQKLNALLEGKTV
jgi:hypothetical protein